jgi:hypothetical protein
VLIVSFAVDTKRDNITTGDASMEDHISHIVGSRTLAGALFAITFINDVNAAGWVSFEE